MSDIKMIKYHTLPLDQAKKLVQKAADDLSGDYDLASEWHGNTLKFQRSGVEGEMHVTSAEIRLDVTLGWLLRPFKARFVESIEHNFDKLLRTSGAVKAVKPTAKTAQKAAARKAAKTSRKPR